MRPSRAAVLARAILYLLYLFLSTAGTFLLIELGLAAADRLSPGSFPLLLRSDYPDRPEGYFKIAIIGESTAWGQMAERGFEQVLAHDLPLRYPGKKFYIRNFARPGTYFHGHGAAIARTIAPRYDLLLIYSGHNEVNVHLDEVGRFRKPEFRSSREVSRRPGEETSRFWRFLDENSRLYSLVLRYRVQRQAQFLEESGGAEAELRLPEFADSGLLPPEERAKLAPRFKQDLEEVARRAERHGHRVIVMSNVSAESWPPQFSVIKASVTPEQRKRLLLHYANGVRLLDQGKPREALPEVMAALAIDPDVAVLNYLSGRAHEILGAKAESHRFYRRAIDTDGYPARAPLELYSGAAQVAASHRGSVQYVDMVPVFNRLVDRGYPWSSLFHDLQHVTLVGHVILGLGFLEAIGDLPEFQKLSPGPQRVNFDTIDLVFLDRYYRQALGVTSIDEAEAAWARASWFINFMNRTAYPASLLPRAEENLLLFRAKAGPAGEEVFNRGAARLASKKRQLGIPGAAVTPWRAKSASSSGLSSASATSRAFIPSAPRDQIRRRTAGKPRLAACPVRGVPRESCFGSAPSSSRSLTISRAPASTALHRGKGN